MNEIEYIVYREYPDIELEVDEDAEYTHWLWSGGHMIGVGDSREEAFACAYEWIQERN